MNQNYNYIANLLTEIANGHPQLQDVRLSFQDQRSLFHEKAKGLPVLYANVTNLQYLEYTCNWDIDIYIMDNILDNRENEQSIMNSTGEIVNHIINFIKNEKFNDYRFLDIGFAQPLNNFDNNRMNGWIFRTRIETKREQCYTPIQSGVVPILCADATYTVQYEDGTLIEQGTIPSGGSVTVEVPNVITCLDANWTLTDTLGNTLDSGTIPSGGSATIVAPNGTVSVQNSQGNTVDSGVVLSGGSEVFNAPDADVTLNGVSFPSIPSGGSDNIQVRQSSGTTLIGSKQGAHWRVGDSVITLNNSAGTTLQTENVKATDPATLTAPDGTAINTDGTFTLPVPSGGSATIPDSQINVNGVNEGDVVSVQTIDVNVTDGVDPVTPDAVTLVGNVMTIEVPSGGGGEWQRPADWLPMPAVVDTDDIFVGLYAIFPSGNNFAAFRFTTNTGDYQVDWGDGTVTTHASNTVAEHEYDYATYDISNSTLSGRGYKQSIITVTPLTGELRTANFDLRFTTTPAQNQPYATGFLDCILSMPNCQSGFVSINFSSSNQITHRYVERFRLINSGNATDERSLFRNCSSLVVAEVDCTNFTNISFMFNSCSSLQIIELFNISNVATTANMFENCSSLKSVPLFDTSSVTNMESMFQGCTSLQSVPLFDTSIVTNMRFMFNGCSSLRSVPLLNTSSVTSMLFIFQNCSSLQSVPLLNTSSVAIMDRMFFNCFSLNEIPAFNTANVTTMNLFASTCNSLDTTDIICPVSVNFNNCQLSQSELVNIFNNLVDRTATTAANINISGNWGASALTTAERDIALNKNWTITG